MCLLLSVPTATAVVWEYHISPWAIGMLIFPVPSRIQHHIQQVLPSETHLSPGKLNGSSAPGGPPFPSGSSFLLRPLLLLTLVSPVPPLHLPPSYSLSSHHIFVNALSSAQNAFLQLRKTSPRPVQAHLPLWEMVISLPRVLEASCRSIFL